MPVSSSTTSRQIRCSSRCIPTTALESHGRDWSSGPVNISYSRKVSTPYSVKMSSGVIMFFRLLPILPNSRRTGWPAWLNPSAVWMTSDAWTYIPRASV